MSGGPYNLINYYSMNSYTNTAGAISILRNKGANEQIDFTNMVISTTDVTVNSVSLDAVMNSFNGLKKVSYDNFYILNLILKNSSQILASGRYDTVLQPIVELDYFNGKDYFWIESLPLVDSDNQIGMSYFKWQQYSQYSNLRMVDVNSMNPIFYKSTSTSQSGNMSKIRTIFNQLKEKSTSQYIYEIGLILPFNNSLRLYLYTIFPNILKGPQHTEWVMVANCVDLEQYFPSSFPSSLNLQYVKLVDSINTSIGVLQQSNWTDLTKFDNTWSFTSIANVSKCTCLYSNSNSPYADASWIGKSYLNCFIKNSNMDNPGRIYQMIVDLNQNYGPLTVGQVIFATYTYGNEYYVSVIKICNTSAINVTTPISQLGLQVDCFKEKIIYVNSFIKPDLTVIGDSVINGNLLVQTFDKNPILKTDNVNRITTFNNKIGINQPSYMVNGLLDIANLSVSGVTNLLESFSTNELNSYDVALFVSIFIRDPAITVGSSALTTLLQQKYSSLLSSNDLSVLFTALSTYQYNSSFVIPSSITMPLGFQNISIFSTRILKNISNNSSNIIYYTSTGSFLSGQNPYLSSDSFAKINRIVNEIYKMKTQNLFQNYPIFSFTEILNDNEYNYLCSIRVIFYTNSYFPLNLDGSPNALCFTISSLNIHSIMINPALSKTFQTIIEQISSARKLVNYASLLIYQPSIGLYTNDSTNLNTSSDICKRFTDYIGNSTYFRSRFYGNNIYIFCNQLMPSTASLVLTPYSNNITYEKILFNESNPQWSGQDSKTIFIQENDSVVSRASYSIYRNLLNKFEFRQNMQFGVDYKWNYGQKYSNCMLFTVNNVTYVLGCGINLENIISKSILSNGDTLLSGDVKITDSSNNTIFQISNVEKKLISAYKIGVGNEQPQTTLDVTDTSMASILSVIDKISNTLLLLYSNLSILSTANLSTNLSINAVVSSLVDTNGTLLKDNQNPFYYGSIYKISNDYLVGNQSVVYNWLFGSSGMPNQIWNNSSSTFLPKPINSLPSSKQLDFLSKYMSELLTTRFIFPGTTVSNNVNWVYGKKHAFTLFFRNTLDSSVYCFASGIDLQQYNLRYNTNDNIEKLFLCIDTYQSLLQVIINPIPTVQLLGIPLSQHVQATETLKNNLSLYGNPTRIMRYKIYPNNLLKSVVYRSVNTPDYTSVTDTLEKMVILFNTPLNFVFYDGNEADSTIYQMADNNILAMSQSLVKNITKLFKTLTSGQNGIVWFEDLYQYYLSLFYCVSTGTDSVYGQYYIVTSIERKLEEFIIPTLNIKGDTRISGEISTRSIENPVANFSTIDPDRKFIGFNTDEREFFYTYLNPSLQNPLIYALNNDYPSATFDRLFETTDYTIVNGVFTSTFPNFFGSSTSMIVKRRSDMFTFNDLFTNSSSLNQKYGVDIAFEMSNQWIESQRLGTVGMVIESVVKDINTAKFTDDCYVKAGFLINATNIDASNLTLGLPTVTNKQLLYITNDGNMKVDSINTTTLTSTNLTLTNFPILPTTSNVANGSLAPLSTNIMTVINDYNLTLQPPNIPQVGNFFFIKNTNVNPVTYGILINLGTFSNNVINVNLNAIPNEPLYNISFVSFTGGLNNGSYTVKISTDLQRTFSVGLSSSVSSINCLNSNVFNSDYSILTLVPYQNFVIMNVKYIQNAYFTSMSLFTQAYTN